MIIPGFQKPFLPLKKLTALFLSVTLLTGPSAIAAPSQLPPPFGISEDLGRHEESSSINTGKKVIFIQDAHDSLEAQENIARMIDQLVEHEGVRTVFEEGYEGPVPTDEYFGEIKDAAVRQKVSYFLLDKLRLGGAEYAHINRKQDFKLIGADNIDLHLKNIESYRDAAQKKEETSKDIEVLEKYIEKLANQYFPKDFKEWLRNKDRFEDQKLGLLEYLKRTWDLNDDAKAAETYPTLNLILNSGDLKDPATTQKLLSVDARTVFSEMDRLENDFASKKLKNERNLKIFEYGKYLLLLEKLNNIEITPPEYEAVKDHLRELRTDALAQFIAKESNKSIILSKRWEENVLASIRFYEISQARDAAIEKRLEEFSRQSEENQAVLVFGGFHKEKIKKILLRQGYSYSIFSPKISAINPRHRNFYKQLMSAGRFNFETPFQVSIAARAASFLYQTFTPQGRSLARAELRAIEKSILDAERKNPAATGILDPLVDQKVQTALAAFKNTQTPRSELRRAKTPRPSSRPIDPDLAKQWVSAHPAEPRELAQFIVDHITHVSQEEFEQTLKDAVEQFNAAIGERPFTTFVLSGDYNLTEDGIYQEPATAGNYNSGDWVADLAEELGMRKPQAVIRRGDEGTAKRFKKWALQNLFIEDIVVADDVSISGIQMLDDMRAVIKEINAARQEKGVPPVKVHFLLPYQTDFARQKILAQYSNSVIYGNGRIIPIGDILRDEAHRSPQKAAKIKALILKYYSLLENSVLTYFDHKIPDNSLTVDYDDDETTVLDGLLLIDPANKSFEKIPFIRNAEEQTAYRTAAYLSFKESVLKRSEVRALQEQLAPRKLQEGLAALLATGEASETPVSVLHISPDSLARFANKLDEGAKTSGLPLQMTTRMPAGADIAAFVSGQEKAAADFTFLEWHGAINEKPVTSLNYPGRLVVLVHRPEEILLRNTSEARDPLFQKADAIVFLGKASIETYQKLYPDKLIVAIPHGFYDSGALDETRLAPDAIAAVGSITTWGEMRKIEDVLKLLEAMKKQPGADQKKILGYIGGKIEAPWENINQYRGRPDVWLLSNAEIDTAVAANGINSAEAFRQWAYSEAKGRAIIRTDIAPAKSPLDQWEQELIDFNVQFYREEINNLPKVEYSGTLHLKAAPSVFVVIDSPSMHDVQNDEGFQMVMAPAAGTQIDYEAGARSIFELLQDPARRRAIINSNIETANKIGVKETAYAYYLLFNHLNARSEARGKSKDPLHLTRAQLMDNVYVLSPDLYSLLEMPGTESLGLAIPSPENWRHSRSTSGVDYILMQSNLILASRLGEWFPGAPELAFVLRAGDAAFLKAPEVLDAEHIQEFLAALWEERLHLAFQRFSLEQWQRIDAIIFKSRHPEINRLRKARREQYSELQRADITNEILPALLMQNSGTVEVTVDKVFPDDLAEILKQIRRDTIPDDGTVDRIMEAAQRIGVRNRDNYRVRLNDWIQGKNLPEEPPAGLTLELESIRAALARPRSEMRAEKTTGDILRESLARDVTEVFNVVKGAYGVGGGVKLKENKTVVTAADYLSQMIVKELIWKLYPGQAFLGEESPEIDDIKAMLADGSPVAEYLRAQSREPLLLKYRRILDEYPVFADQQQVHFVDGRGPPVLWILDPLDGTRSFAEGKNTYGMVLGQLFWNEEKKIYIPRQNIGYAPEYEVDYPQGGPGAKIKGPMIELAFDSSDSPVVRLYETPRTGELNLVTSKLERHTQALNTFLFRESASQGPDAYKPMGQEIANASGQNYREYWVRDVSQRIEGVIGNLSFFTSPDQLWDHAGLLGLLNAAGGKVYRIRGPLQGEAVEGYSVEDIQDALGENGRFPILGAFGEQNQRFAEQLLPEVKRWAFYPAGWKTETDWKYTATISKEGIVRFWNTKTAEKIAPDYPLPFKETDIHTMAFSDDGNRLIIAKKDRTILILNPRTGKQSGSAIAAPGGIDDAVNNLKIGRSELRTTPDDLQQKATLLGIGDLEALQKLTEKNAAVNYGATFIAGLPFEGETLRQISEWNKELGDIHPDLGFDPDNMHSTIGAMFRSQENPVTEADFKNMDSGKPFDLEAALKGISDTTAYRLSFDRIVLNKDGNIVALGSVVENQETGLQRLQKGFEAANFNVKYKAPAPGQPLTVAITLKHIGTDILAGLSEDQAARLRDWVGKHRSLPSPAEVTVTEIKLAAYSDRMLRKLLGKPVVFKLGQKVPQTTPEILKDEILAAFASRSELRATPSGTLDYSKHISDDMVYIVRRMQTLGELEKWLKDLAFVLQNDAVASPELLETTEKLAMLFGFESKPDKGIQDSLGTVFKNASVTPEDKRLIEAFFYADKNYDQAPAVDGYIWENVEAAVSNAIASVSGDYKLFSRIKQYKSLMLKLEKFLQDIGAAPRGTVLTVAETMEKTRENAPALANDPVRHLDDILGFNFVINDDGMNERQRTDAMTRYLTEVEEKLKAIPNAKITAVRKASRAPDLEAEAGNMYVQGLLVHKELGDLPLKIQFRFKSVLTRESIMYFTYKYFGIWTYPPWAEGIKIDEAASFREIQERLFGAFKAYVARRPDTPFNLKQHLNPRVSPSFAGMTIDAMDRRFLNAPVSKAAVSDDVIADLKRRLKKLAEDPSTGLNDVIIDKVLGDIKLGIFKLRGEDLEIIRYENGRETVIETIDRNIAHALGLLHRVSLAFVMTPEGRLLVQRRAHNKAPAFHLDIFGGHIGIRQSYEDGIRREIQEELGLPDDWALQGEFVRIGDEGGFTSPPVNTLNRERRSLYIYKMSAEELEIVRRHDAFLKTQKLGMTREDYQAWQEKEQKQHTTLGAGEVWSYHEFDLDDLIGIVKGNHRLIEDRFADNQVFSLETQPTPDVLLPYMQDEQVLSFLRALPRSEVRVQPAAKFPDFNEWLQARYPGKYPVRDYGEIDGSTLLRANGLMQPEEINPEGLTTNDLDQLEKQLFPLASRKTPTNFNKTLAVLMGKKPSAIVGYSEWIMTPEIEALYKNPGYYPEFDSEDIKAELLEGVAEKIKKALGIEVYKVRSVRRNTIDGKPQEITNEQLKVFHLPSIAQLVVTYSRLFKTVRPKDAALIDELSTRYAEGWSEELRPLLKLILERYFIYNSQHSTTGILLGFPERSVKAYSSGNRKGKAVSSSLLSEYLAEQGSQTQGLITVMEKFWMPAFVNINEQIELAARWESGVRTYDALRERLTRSELRISTLLGKELAAKTAVFDGDFYQIASLHSLLMTHLITMGLLTRLEQGRSAPSKEDPVVLDFVKQYFLNRSGAIGMITSAGTDDRDPETQALEVRFFENMAHWLVDALEGPEKETLREKLTAWETSPGGIAALMAEYSAYSGMVIPEFSLNFPDQLEKTIQHEGLHEVLANGNKLLAKGYTAVLSNPEKTRELKQIFKSTSYAPFLNGDIFVFQLSGGVGEPGLFQFGEEFWTQTISDSLSEEGRARFRKLIEEMTASNDDFKTAVAEKDRLLAGEVAARVTALKTLIGENYPESPAGKAYASRSEVRLAETASVSQAEFDKTVQLKTDVVFTIRPETLKKLTRAKKSGEYDQWLELLGLKMLNEDKLHIVIDAKEEQMLDARGMELLMSHKNVYLGWNARKLPKGAPVIEFEKLINGQIPGDLLNERTARQIDATFDIFNGAFLAALRYAQDPAKLEALAREKKKVVTSLSALDMGLLDQMFKSYAIVSQSA